MGAVIFSYVALWMELLRTPESQQSIVFMLGNVISIKSVKFCFSGLWITTRPLGYLEIKRQMCCYMEQQDIANCWAAQSKREGEIWEILPTGSSSLIPKLSLVTWGEGRLLEDAVAGKCHGCGHNRLWGVTGFMEWRIKEKMPKKKKGILEGGTDFVSELHAKEAWAGLDL